MTRLKQEDIVEISKTLEEYNLELIRKTGCSLREISAHAVGRRASGEFFPRQPKVAVIPMSCGQGIIEGFVESVAGIINYLGFNAIITESRDAGGVAEAVQGGAEILFMADDERFVAVNVRTGKVSDNGEATGKGYVAGLERMCAGLDGKKVLLIGAGPVGNGAAKALARFGAEVAVFDIDLSSSQRLSRDLKKLGHTLKIETNLDAALGQHRILVDACPAKGVIMVEYIAEDTMIAAPGIPLGVEADGVEQVADQLLHDPLQIGVSTMMFDVL